MSVSRYLIPPPALQQPRPVRECAAWLGACAAVRRRDLLGAWRALLCVFRPQCGGYPAE
jgi:hypothetical protein